MVIVATTCFAVYCPDHGLQFITEEQYFNDELRCRFPDCVVICDKEHELLHTSLNEGCNFCGKKPIKPPFVYLPKTREIYCHAACMNCDNHVCASKGCKRSAKYLVYLRVNDNEYLVPVALCREHRKSVPHEPSDAMWVLVSSMMKNDFQLSIERKDCRLVVKKMD